jgi:hypothetical protein
MLDDDLKFMGRKINGFIPDGVEWELSGICDRCGVTISVVLSDEQMRNLRMSHKVTHFDKNDELVEIDEKEN